MTTLGKAFGRPCERRTTLGKAAIGILAGASIGALLATLLTLPLNSETSIFVMVSSIPLILIVAFFVWLAGLFVVGAPSWLALHALGARCQTAAVIYGALASFGAAWITPLNVLFHLSSLQWASAIGACGAIVGYVVAAVAYHPDRPDPA